MGPRPLKLELENNRSNKVMLGAVIAIIVTVFFLAIEWEQR